MAVAAIMLGMFAVSSLATIGLAGNDAAKNSQSVKDSIANSIAQKQQWQDKYNNLIKSGAKDMASMQAEHTILVNEANKLTSELKASQDLFTASYKTLQMYGIIMVSGIFFILLLKKFGLLDALDNYFSNLFRKIF